jgi:hypothetical protein
MNERIIKTCSVGVLFLLVPVLLFSALGYFRDGDIRNLEHSIGGVGSGIGAVDARAKQLEESLSGFTKLIHGVETISNGITESVRQNEAGLSRIKQSVSDIETLVQRIRKEGITTD